jgi:predicted ribonuclease YlaK
MSKAKRKFDTSGEVDQDKIRSIGNRKRFHPHDLIAIKPKTDSQSQFFDAFNSDVPMILQSGCAGTGKTFLALYSALHQVFDPSSPYEKVCIFRSAVESRKIGFMPGSEEEKASVYERPYQQIAMDVMKFNNPYPMLKSLGYLEFHLTSHLRGSTFDNTIMLIDECQNLDRGEIKTILTRCGENSRIILCGDSKQDDLVRYREKSSFDYLEKLMLNMPYEETASIQYGLDDIVRSGLVKSILIADSNIPE